MPVIKTEEKVPENTAAPSKGTGRKYKERIMTIGRGAAAISYALLLFWYCSTPDFYGGGGMRGLFTSPRTWFMIVAVTVLIALSVSPNRLPDRINRGLGYAWCVLAPFAVYFSLLYLNAVRFKIHFFELNKIALVFTFWFLFGVLFLFLLVSGSIRLSVILLAVPIAVLGIVNCFIIQFRGMAISAGDLFSLGTAMTVAASYKYEIDWYIFMEVFLTFTICVLSLKLRGFRLFSWKQRTAVAAVWLVFTGSFFHICCGTSFLQDHDIRSEGFTHQLRYKQFDMIFTTLCTCFYLAVDKPDGYSLDRVQELAEDYIDPSAVQSAGADDAPEEENAGPLLSSMPTVSAAETETTGASGAAGQMPNVIVIMSESLADYSDIGNGIELSEDCLPFFHSLKENTIRGTAYASIFGANTPNSEYEFLTGNTMGFLPPSSVGFHLFVRGAMPSLASELKNAGYDTLAIHPYRGTNYRRNIVYPQIGFDKYYARVNFTSPEYVRNYISDQELVDRIISEYEKHNQKTDAPLFSYNVTMQNHGGYSFSNTKNLENTIQVLTPGIDVEKAQVYTNLLKTSDSALENLIGYFQTQDEPTVIIMFGDHQPNLGDDTYAYLIGNEEELTPEERMEKYKIPFIAWANYDIEEETIEKTSLNYLYSILADRLNLPMTGYQDYLLDLSEELPVLAAGGYWTKDGEFYTLDDKESPYFELVNDYNILEYNYIFGKNHRCLELFT